MQYLLKGFLNNLYKQINSQSATKTPVSGKVTSKLKTKKFEWSLSE